MDTLRRSSNPTTVMTASGLQTNEKVQVCVHDLNLFVTMQLLEETPAVPSLGKLCSEHGCSYEWKNGETPRLTQNGKTITCFMNNFVPLVVPRLSSSSSSGSASTSRPKDQSKSSGESEASTDPMTTRRAKHACGKPMQTNLDKQASESRADHNVLNMKEVNPGKITSTLSWCKISPLSGYNVRTRIRRRRRRVYEGLSSFLKKPKVIYTNISLEFGKYFEELSWNHRTCTFYRSETNGIKERDLGLYDE